MDYVEQDLAGIRLVYWNPRLPRTKRRVNNFGDLLGPLIAAEMVSRLELTDASAEGRLLTVGSIVHFASESDHVWGAGVNGKIPPGRITKDSLDFRLVRGPRSRSILQALGHDVPAVYGDPALLLPLLFPYTASWVEQKTRRLAVVPNLNEADKYREHPDFVDPTGEPWDVIRSILQAEFVVGSSLHATIVADAYGVPARATLSESENYLKYYDHYAATGRSRLAFAPTIEDALRLGAAPAPEIELDSIYSSFPADLWGNESRKQRRLNWRHRTAIDLIHDADWLWEIDRYADDPQVRARDLTRQVLVLAERDLSALDAPEERLPAQLRDRAAAAFDEIVAAAPQSVLSKMTKETRWDARIIAAREFPLLSLTPSRLEKIPNATALAATVARNLNGYIRLREILGDSAKDLFSTVLRHNLLPAIREVMVSREPFDPGWLEVPLAFQRALVPRARLDAEELHLIETYASDAFDPDGYMLEAFTAHNAHIDARLEADAHKLVIKPQTETAPHGVHVAEIIAEITRPDHTDVRIASNTGFWLKAFDREDRVSLWARVGRGGVSTVMPIAASPNAAVPAPLSLLESEPLEFRLTNAKNRSRK